MDFLIFLLLDYVHIIQDFEKTSKKKKGMNKQTRFYDNNEKAQTNKYFPKQRERYNIIQTWDHWVAVNVWWIICYKAARKLKDNYIITCSGML